MNTMAARLAYRLLLRLHPASFQHEFAADMLWIFDEEQQQGSTVYLFFDGARFFAAATLPAAERSRPAIHHVGNDYQHSWDRHASLVPGWPVVLGDLLQS